MKIATQVCRAFHLPPGTPSGLRSDGVSPTTAGKITELAARFLGHGLSPWNELPGSHFVAECSYANLAAASTPATTSCPNGAHISLETIPAAQFYVDQNQRWSADSIADALGQPSAASLCSAPTSGP